MTISKQIRRVVLLAAGASMAAGVAMAGPKDRTLSLPADYKASFERYMVADRQGQDDQVMAIYANKIALEGARKDGKLPLGSVLIGEVYAAKKDENGKVIESALGRRIPGELKAIVLMERGEGWGDQYGKELAVGDWEFEKFSAKGENANADTSGCRTCHAPLADSEYTFSYEHLTAGM